MDSVIITSDLDIRHSDLMLKVDFLKQFTLRDLMRASVSSSDISVQEMSDLVRCEFIQELWEEAEDNPYEPFPLDQIESIQLTYSMETFIVKPEVNFHDAYWELSGCNRDGKVTTSLDMSPTYRLSELPIRLAPISEWHEFHGDNISSKNLKFHPPITLLELLHAVYWHLSLFGPPDQREQMIDQFVDVVRNLYLSNRRKPTVESVKRSLKGVD